MFHVKTRFHFDAAHFLEGHSGKCRHLHGHRWEVVVCLAVPSANEAGLALDFANLRDLVAPLVNQMDHSLLNDNPFFAGNPTAERIAEMLFRYVQAQITESGLRAVVASIEVFESPTASVIFSEGSGVPC